MKHIGWFGYGNLGDDEMERILKERFSEISDEWYTLGGGTLIAPTSQYYQAMEFPERTFGISLGVSSKWAGEWVEVLRSMKKIYTRDLFSHYKLLEYNVENILSVDLWCYRKPTARGNRRLMANIIKAPQSTHEYMNKISADTYEYCKALGCDFFSMSNAEDTDMMTESKLFTDGQYLINQLSGAKTVWSMRLHATVAAWVAGVKDIRALHYDPKIQHFFERVVTLNPAEAKNIINIHLDEIEVLCK